MLKAGGRMAVQERVLIRSLTALTTFCLFVCYMLVHNIAILYSMTSENDLPLYAESRQPRDLSSVRLSPGVPATVARALAQNRVTGYLRGNSSHLHFEPYPDRVDLRVIVLAFDRAASLYKCLTSLEEADYENDTVSIHVWLDPLEETGRVDPETYHVASEFNFTQGGYYIHIQRTHVGIQGQWTNTWRPHTDATEIGLILEDDVTVSRYFWRWLRNAHAHYGNRSDVSGCGLSHPGISHQAGRYLDIQEEYIVYLYKVICTWGFSPTKQSWRKYQDWFYRIDQNRSFDPIVGDILPSQWYLGEKKKNVQRNLWEMWHIYYTDHAKPPQYNVLLNSIYNGLLAVNRHEDGLHDQGHGVATDPLCDEWSEDYDIFSPNPPKFNYDGELEPPE